MQSDLFAFVRPPASAVSYTKAFSEWVAAESRAGRLRRADSTRVYAHMWEALTQWAVGRSIPIRDLDAEALEAYLASRGAAEELTPRYALRFLQLVDRILQHHSRTALDEHGIRAQTAAARLLLRRPDLRFAGSADQDPIPSYLDAAQARRLVAFLGAVGPGRGVEQTRWQDIRNRTSVALMLGAGLTPGEVRALTLTDVVVAGGRAAGIPWKLAVAQSPGTPAREAPLAAWAGRLLARWLGVRRDCGIPGTILLPGTRTAGNAWSKRSQHLATAEVLADAGVDDVEGGSYRLRHTFAMRQLRRGRRPEEVARWLGIMDLKVMDRYRRIVPAPVDVA